jgi:HK97 family phage portal protein
VLHDEPNEEMTSFVMREVMLSHLLLWGNSYSQIIRNGRNHIVGLYPLLPDRMEVDRNSVGILTYTYTTAEGRTVRLAPDEVLHIPGLGFDGVMGYSPIALEKSAIGLGIAAEEYGSKFFANGATQINFRPGRTHAFGSQPAFYRAGSLEVSGESWNEVSAVHGCSFPLETGCRFGNEPLPP